MFGGMRDLRPSLIIKLRSGPQRKVEKEVNGALHMAMHSKLTKPLMKRLKIEACVYRILHTIGYEGPKIITHYKRKSQEKRQQKKSFITYAITP